MIKNLLFIFASFVCISAYNNFFTEIRKDPDACNYYVPNQERCQRVFVNIEALIKTPGWMKIDLQTIMPEISNFFLTVGQNNFGNKIPYLFPCSN